MKAAASGFKTEAVNSSASSVKCSAQPAFAAFGPACHAFILVGMSLAENQLRFLRGKSHPLKPLILIGQSGLTDGVCAEADRALNDHELIKVKVRGAERGARDTLLAQLAQRTNSTLVQRIGHVAALYRAHPKTPKLIIPDAPLRAVQT
jgi:RNA-binding protein